MGDEEVSSMSTDVLSYEPERLHSLLARAEAAADHLGGWEPADPLAADAVAIARIIRGHALDGWLPALTAVESSAALIDPLSTAPTAAAGWRRAKGDPTPFGMTNGEALAAAQAATAAHRPGVFVGTTETYEVLETPPSTSVPTNGQDPDGGSGMYDIIVTDHWYEEHNLGHGPALFAASPGGSIPSIVARLFGRDEPPEDLMERGRALEARAREALQDPVDGPIGKDRNVAVGRLTKSDGEEIEYQAVSGRKDRDGYVESPPAGQRVFHSDEAHAFDTEVKILEDVVRQLPDRNTDAIVEIFTELEPCGSCSRIIEDFHAMHPNVQVRIFYRLDVSAG
jgi:hypothetical protein